MVFLLSPPDVLLQAVAEMTSIDAIINDIILFFIFGVPFFLRMNYTIQNISTCVVGMIFSSYSCDNETFLSTFFKK